MSLCKNIYKLHFISLNLYFCILLKPLSKVLYIYSYYFALHFVLYKPYLWYCSVNLYMYFLRHYINGRINPSLDIQYIVSAVKKLLYSSVFYIHVLCYYINCNIILSLSVYTSLHKLWYYSVLLYIYFLRHCINCAIALANKN